MSVDQNRLWNGQGVRHGGPPRSAGIPAVTLSPYWRDGKLAQSKDGSWEATEDECRTAREFATAVLQDPRASLPSAVVLDVGVIRGEGWAVVEANAAWGSGIYGCDPDQVLGVVQRACVSSGGSVSTRSS
jgi:hypothetical protein